MYQLTEKHFLSALRLPGDERYSYFVKRVVDWGFIYSLESSNGWALAADEIDSQILPLWPHKRFAEACKYGEWADCRVATITTSEFINKLTGNLTQRSIRVGVFPIPETRGLVVTPEILSRDIEESLGEIN